MMLFFPYGLQFTLQFFKCCHYRTPHFFFFCSSPEIRFSLVCVTSCLVVCFLFSSDSRLGPSVRLKNNSNMFNILSYIAPHHGCKVSLLFALKAHFQRFRSAFAMTESILFFDENMPVFRVVVFDKSTSAEK